MGKAIEGQPPLPWSFKTLIAWPGTKYRSTGTSDIPKVNKGRFTQIMHSTALHFHYFYISMQ